MRAIQHFYKKFNRYPNKIEELENTNNVRFLRRRYNRSHEPGPSHGQGKGFQVPASARRHVKQRAGIARRAWAERARRVARPWRNASSHGRPRGTGGCGPTAGIGRANRSQQRYQFSCGQLIHWEPVERQSECAGSVRCQSEWNIQQRLQRPTLGGGPILGVASASKAKSIRVYFKKDHYNDWLFIYTTQMVGGGLLIGPINPGMPSAETWADSLLDRWRRARKDRADPGKVDLDRADLAKAAWAKAVWARWPWAGRIRTGIKRRPTAANSTDACSAAAVECGPRGQFPRSPGIRDRSKRKAPLDAGFCTFYTSVKH